MAKAFTIIETVIAVLIVSVIGIGVMNSSSNYAKLFAHLETKSLNFERISIIGLNSTEDFKGSSKNLTDFLTKYDIQNDLILDHLKSIDFRYDETQPKSLTTPKETSSQKWEELQELQKNQDIDSQTQDVQFSTIESMAIGTLLNAKILNIRQLND